MSVDQRVIAAGVLAQAVTTSNLVGDHLDGIFGRLRKRHRTTSQACRSSIAGRSAEGKCAFVRQVCLLLDEVHLGCQACLRGGRQPGTHGRPAEIAAWLPKLRARHPWQLKKSQRVTTSLREIGTNTSSGSLLFRGVTMSNLISDAKCA